MTPGVQPELQGLLILAQIEALARQARSEKELQFVMVNETKRLVSYRQAALVALPRGAGGESRLQAVSAVAVLDPRAPYARWMQRTIRYLSGEHLRGACLRVSAEDLPDDLCTDWSEYASEYVLLCPLRTPDGALVGALWLARDEPWREHELTVTDRLVQTYAHAWAALNGRRRFLGRRWWPSRILRYALVAVLALALFVPVSLTTLAPAEIVARDPAVVSAPMDGVIAEILAPPNSQVAAGQPVFGYEDTNLRNQHEVAQRTLAVTFAAYRTAIQGAFNDPRSSAEVALLKAQVDLSQAESDFARELLDQVIVRSPRAGLLLYSTAQEWVGRPVAVGERVMQVADPEQVELRIALPVTDAIALREGARVQVFLDVDPLSSLEARIERFSYDAQVTAANVLAYRVTAALGREAAAVRIGLKGTAKIHGERVPLGLLIFRRPLSALRQYFGV